MLKGRGQNSQLVVGLSVETSRTHPRITLHMTLSQNSTLSPRPIVQIVGAVQQMNLQEYISPHPP